MTLRVALWIAGLFALRLAAYALVDGLHASIAHDYCVWDCGWYVNVAANGYALSPNVGVAATYGQANWAFFPLYPLMMHATTWLLPVSYAAAGLISANLFLLLFVGVAVLYLPRRRPGVNQVALATFLLAFPYGVYFSLAYTESLYVLLATVALYALSMNRLTASAGILALISATRVTGILFTPIVVARALAPAATAWRAGDQRLALRHVADGLLPIALAPLGLFVFMAYLYMHMGDGLAFAHIQAGWGRHAASPFATLRDNLHAVDWDLAFGRKAQSIVVSEYAAVAGLILCVRLLYLRLWAESWLLAGTVVLGLSAGLESMQRYVLANPVFLIFLFDWLWQSAFFRRYFFPLTAACFALQLAFAHWWLESYAFLM